MVIQFIQKNIAAFVFGLQKLFQEQDGIFVFDYRGVGISLPLEFFYFTDLLVTYPYQANLAGFISFQSFLDGMYIEGFSR